MKNNYKILVCFILLLALMGKENKVAAQTDEEWFEWQFTNPVATTDCCPRQKKIIDSIMNYSPFVFEGRMIRDGGYKQGYFYYLFEIEKVYRGGEQLKEGTVEIVSRMPRSSNDPPSVGFGHALYFIFAKEINVSGMFEANNSVKLEVFYNTDNYGSKHVTSRFYETVSPNPLYYGSSLGLNFKTKENLRDFFATYGLIPADVSKADTLMIFTKQEAEDIRKAEENRAKQAEKLKVLYQKRLELEWKMNNNNKKRINKKEIDNNLLKYEKASDSIRQRMFYEQQDRYFRILDSIAKENQRESQQGQTKSTSSEANLTFSIQNTKTTTTQNDSFLEFDIIFRADKEPDEIWVTPRSLFIATFA